MEDANYTATVLSEIGPAIGQVEGERRNQRNQRIYFNEHLSLLMVQ